MAGDVPPILIDVQLEMGRIKGQLDTLQTELKQVGSAAKAQTGSIGGLEKSLGKMAGSFKKMLGAAAVTSLLVGSAKAAGEDAKSIALLNNQLEISTGATKEQMTAIDGQIGKMSMAAGIADDDIRPAFATLVRSTKDTEKAMALTNLALDAAAAKGKDAGTVANALAKAQNGNTKSLAMLFPELKNSKDMLGDLAANTKGAAEAAANADPMMRLGVIFDELKETLGRALIPLLNSFIKILNPLMPIIQLVADVVSYLVEALMPLVEAIMTAVRPAFEAIMKAIKPILEKLLPPLIKLLDKILIPVLMFLADIIIMYLVPYWEKLAEVLGGGLTWLVDGLTAAFESLMKILAPFWENILKPIVDSLMAMLGIKVEPVIRPKVDKTEIEGLDYSGLSGLSILTGSGVKSSSSSTKENPAAKAAAAAKKIQDDILNAQKSYQAAIIKAQDDYTQTITSRMKDFTKAFEDATKVNVADLFNSGYQSADMLIEGLKDKLTSIKTFAADIAALSAAGYTEEFMLQLQSLGPVAGDQLAQAILTASPNVQDELKSLYSEASLLSKTGVDSVAQNLIPTFTDATKLLGQTMLDAANQLKTSLASISKMTPAQVTAASGIVPVVKKSPAATTTKAGNTLIVNTPVMNSGSSAKEVATQVVSAIKFNQPFMLTDYAQTAADQAVANIYAEWGQNWMGNY